MQAEPGISGVERRERLRRFVENRQRVSVYEVCEAFGVSPATVRRDLEELARAGQLRRVHGGALAPSSAPPEPPVAQRSSEQAEEKQRIGRAAAALIEDGDTVFLSSGTTVQEVARSLRGRRNLTVVTNSLLVLNTLADVSAITLVGLGGIMRQSELSFIGHLTEQALNEFRVNKVILGIRGADTQAGLTNDYLPETQTDRTILKIGKQVILVADHTKCQRVSSVFLAPIEVVHTFVTDTATSPEFIAALETAGIRVIAV